MWCDWSVTNKQYCKALEVTSLSREQVAAVLVDMKQRIRGDFFVIEQEMRRSC